MIKLLRFPTDISTDNPLINIRFYINCLSMTTFISNEELTETATNYYKIPRITKLDKDKNLHCSYIVPISNNSRGKFSMSNVSYLTLTHEYNLHQIPFT